MFVSVGYKDNYNDYIVKMLTRNKKTLIKVTTNNIVFITNL